MIACRPGRLPERTRDLACIAAIGLGSLAIAALLELPVPFPIGDSWVGSWCARQLVEGGRLVLSDAQAMSLVAQLWLAAPVGWIFSPSPAVFNALAFALSAATAALWFVAYRGLGLSRVTSLFGVAVLVSNPIWLAQSVVFETEIPFLFYCGIGAVALVAWHRGAGAAAIWVAALAFAAAALTRQHGVVFAATGLAYTAWSRARRAAPRAPWTLPVLALAAFYAWLALSHGVPKAYGFHQHFVLAQLADPPRLALSLALGLLFAAHYGGAFLLPVVPLAPLSGAAVPRRTWRAVALGLGAATALAASLGLRMPYAPNVITLEAALAPLNLAPSPRLEYALTIVTLGAALAAARLALGRRAAQRTAASASAALRFFGASGLALFVFSLATGLGFDRYLLLPLPFLLPWLLPAAPPSPTRLAAASGIAAASLLFSLYYVDQRIRSFRCEWEAAEELVAGGVDAAAIDAGYAFNGYYAYPSLSRTHGTDSAAPWPAWRHPGAGFLVRSFPLVDPRVREIERRRCANRPGLVPYTVYVYQRLVPGGPPLPTAQDPR